MSGHSKWSQIKRSKGVTDAKRAKLFTKLARVITVTTREGGEDQDTNFKLRLATEQAKQANMPKENIMRAIKRGSGKLDEGKKIEEITYEAYGPGKVALLIQVITDNRNRTISELRRILSQSGGQLAESGSVAWMFKCYGLLIIDHCQKQVVNLDDFELQIIDWGATEMKAKETDLFIYTNPQNLTTLKQKLEQQNIKITSSELIWESKNKITMERAEVKEKIDRLLDQLDEHTDVNEIYTNLEE